MAAMHWIRFASKNEHKRAIMALLDVPGVESLGLPGLQMVVTDEHLKALKHAKIAFRQLSKAASNGQVQATIQS